jgi:hypothetical protein
MTSNPTAVTRDFEIAQIKQDLASSRGLEKAHLLKLQRLSK